MKRTQWLMAGVAAAGILAAAYGFAVQSSPEDGGAPAPLQAAQANLDRILLKVEKLSCGSCEARIRDALLRDPAVKAVAVDLRAGTATVEYDAQAVDPKRLADTVTGLGYPATLLASGSSVAPVGAQPARRTGGCGGSCCSGT